MDKKRFYTQWSLGGNNLPRDESWKG